MSRSQTPTNDGHDCGLAPAPRPDTDTGSDVWPFPFSHSGCVALLSTTETFSDNWDSPNSFLLGKTCAVTICQCLDALNTAKRGSTIVGDVRIGQWIKNLPFLYMWFGFWRIQDCSKKETFVHPLPSFHPVVL